MFGKAFDEFVLVVPDDPKREDRLEEDEFDELDDEPENNESSVCVTVCSAASTSCAAWALVVDEVDVVCADC